METIGNRAYNEIVKRSGEKGIPKYKESLEMGITSTLLAKWRDGYNPSAYYLQQMALAGYDVIYILTGERRTNEG